MKRKLNEIAKKVIYSATAAIASSFPSKAEAISPVTYDKANTDNSAIISDNKIVKEELILHKSNTVPADNTLFHRSHRSHSSHRSHYSSYTQRAQKKDTSNEVKRTAQPRNQTQNQNTNEPTLINKFGSRQLSKGMKGMDVADLQSLLLKKGYKVQVTASFDEQTFEALKVFQKSKKIDATGQMDVLTLWYLQNDQK